MRFHFYYHFVLVLTSTKAGDFTLTRLYKDLRSTYLQEAKLLGMHHVRDDSEGVERSQYTMDPTVTHVHSAATAATVEKGAYALSPPLIDFLRDQARTLARLGKLPPGIDPEKGPWLTLCTVSSNHVTRMPSGDLVARFDGDDFQRSLIGRKSGRAIWCKSYIFLIYQIVLIIITGTTVTVL